MIINIIKTIVIVSYICVTTLAFAETEETIVANKYKAWCQTIGEAKGDPRKVTKFYAH
jgi:hypothetical protein